MGLDQYAYAVYPHAENTDTNIGWRRGDASTDADDVYVKRQGGIIMTPIENVKFQKDEEKETLKLMLDGPTFSKPVIEIARWRKHPNLQGWMQELYNSKHGTEQFNCQPVRVTLTDLEQLETVINRSELPKTEGFFFGDDADEYYKEEDLKFIKNARYFISQGAEVYYDSWW